MYFTRQENYTRRSRRFALTTVGILAVAATLAACGGGASTPRAASGSTPSTASVRSSSGSSTQGTGLLAYSSCMRSHGVPNFPDPAGSGGIPKSAVISAFQEVSNSQAEVAQSACKHLLPTGGSLSGQAAQPVTAQDQQDYLKAAACMRSHGITNFPDPSFSGSTVEFPELEHLVNVNSPQFKHAYKVCQKFIPPGLPYSSRGTS